MDDGKAPKASKNIAIHYRGDDHRFHTIFTNKLVSDNPRPAEMTGRQFKKKKQKQKDKMTGPRAGRHAQKILNSITGK